MKLLLQGLQVMGTLLPPVEAPAETGTTASPAPAPSGGTSGPSTALNGQQEIVILAVSAQQSEVLKFAQMDGQRSRWHCAPPPTSSTRPPGPRSRRSRLQTTGIILKTLVDSYGVLPPEVVQTVTPTATKKP